MTRPSVSSRTATWCSMTWGIGPSRCASNSPPTASTCRKPAALRPPTVVLMQDSPGQQIRGFTFPRVHRCSSGSPAADPAGAVGFLHPASPSAAPDGRRSPGGSRHRQRCSCSAARPRSARACQTPPSLPAESFIWRVPDRIPVPWCVDHCPASGFCWFLSAGCGCGGRRSVQQDHVTPPRLCRSGISGWGGSIDRDAQ